VRRTHPASKPAPTRGASKSKAAPLKKETPVPGERKGSPKSQVKAKGEEENTGWGLADSALNEGRDKGKTAKCEQYKPGRTEPPEVRARTKSATRQKKKAEEKLPLRHSLKGGNERSKKGRGYLRPPI